MAIVKMSKFTLLTFDYFRDDVLKSLQKFENVHFRNLVQTDLNELDYLSGYSSNELISKCESEIAKLKFVFEKIGSLVEKPKMIKKLTAPKKTLTFAEFDNFINEFDYIEVYNGVKEKDEQLKSLKSERNKLSAENDILKGWFKLDVDSKQLDKFSNVKYFMGTVNKSIVESFRESVESKFNTSYVETLGSIKDEVCVFVLVHADDFAEASTHIKNIGFSSATIHFNDVPVKTIEKNNKRIAQIDENIQVINEGLKIYTKDFENMQVANDYYLATLERAKACENFLKLENIILIEGWTPDEEKDNLEKIVEESCAKDYYIGFEEVPKDSEEVPVKIKNNKFNSAFEDITKMYSTPRYGEIDPTPVTAPFYFAFFGIMLGDFGYGLVMFLATTIALKFFTLGEGGRNFMKFLFALSFSVMFFGIIFGSMFGFEFFAPIQTVIDGEVVNKPILSTSLDIVPLILLSIAIGFFQLIFGLCVKFYMCVRDGNVFAAFADSFTWILSVSGLVGIILAAAGVLPPVGFTISMWMMIIGFVGLALTQGRESPSLGGKIGNGLYSVYNITGYVGDLVSYSRLAALLLSGAYIAYSFNLMAGLLPAGPFYIVKIVFGGAIVIFGQLFNLGISGLGCYVHSCRLQYVEYFGKFYEGGGKTFRAFSANNKFIEIENNKI